MPIDTARRVLELILILEENPLNAPVYFISNTASSTIEYVKSFLEWMSDSIAKSFEHTRDNAFLLKHVTIVIDKNGLDNLPPGPKVILASMASLEAGFSHDIFVEWATDPRNFVLFTERGQYATVARMLQADPPPKAVKVTMSERIPLVGDELIAYEEERNRLKKEEALKDAIIKEEESKASRVSENLSDPMIVDAVDDTLWGWHRDIFIDGFVPPPNSVSLMFPFYENSSEWDDFGEVINPDDYVIKDDDMNPGSIGFANDIDGQADGELASIKVDVKPSKVVSTELTVPVRCSLVYMDFEGRADSRAIKSILAHVAPLKLVLVRGSAEATEHLKQHGMKHVCPHVYAPQIEETIDVTSDLCAYKVQLSEKLMSNVVFKKLGDYEISWIDAEVGTTENTMLSLLPLSMQAPPPRHESVLVGDLKMADFKQFLASKGVQVEFAGGALRCGEYVTLRKVSDASQKGAVSGTQQVVLEGPLCEDHYKIRDYLYSQFHFALTTLWYCRILKCGCMR